MKYYLDTEFNGHGGKLISMALVAEDGRELYLAMKCHKPVEWVRDNVLPIITCPGATPVYLGARHFADEIALFLAGDRQVHIITDWPTDIEYFCESIITSPGEMINVRNITFSMIRVNAYPTLLPGAIQHNALWDARALRHYVEKHS